MDEVNDQLSVDSYGADRRHLILTHKAAVTFHIGTKDGAELTFDTPCGHGITPQGFEIERIGAMDISGVNLKDI
jgi:hypothetical protein